MSTHRIDLLGCITQPDGSVVAAFLSYVPEAPEAGRLFVWSAVDRGWRTAGRDHPYASPPRFEARPITAPVQ